ncbi:MAG: BREX system P-loop protein BrxC, partial [Shewanella oncorhynchi]
AVNRQTEVILFNIDSRADTEDKEDAILKVFLRVFNERLGYCADHPHIAHLERELDARNQYYTFKTKFAELSDSTWDEERDAYGFYRDQMAQAWAYATGQSEASSVQSMENLESMFTLDISNFCKWVREYLDHSAQQMGADDKRIVFLVDEVGQFIGNNTQMMLKLQTITENLGSACGGRAWVIVTSQEDIDAVLGDLSAKKGQDFSKIQGRFHTRISLSSSNTNEVIQKRLLEKTDEAKDQLAELFIQKGDILRNQLAFDATTTAELTNYRDNVEFIDHYPFIPYQYLLVQKVFEAIRKVGATGKHLSRGERSLLDAFQNAARQQMDKGVGVLVPFHAFYPAIESFLDTNVKRIFEQAAEKDCLDVYDVNILKSLFLIRYVDLVKSTLDNLVTLSIEEIDIDKVTLRKRIETSLQRLENQLLITRNGDEYVFLTNEEKEVEQEIKHTQVESVEVTRKLSKIVFEEVLGNRRQYRYPVNKQDYPISRFCNGHPLDGSVQTDLVIKVISPLDANFDDYQDQGCKALSLEGHGSVVIRMPEDKRLWDEFDTWLKTEKFLAGNRSQRPEQEKLLAEKAMKNTQRSMRLKLLFEDLIKQSPFFAIGNELQIKSSSVLNMLDEAFHYVIENSFQKLSLLKSCGGNPQQELKAVIVADDLAQLNMHLGEQDPNSSAKHEIELYLNTSGETNKAVYLKDLLERFSARPYGWNRDEVMLQVAHLVLLGKAALSTPNGALALNRSYDQFTSVRSHATLRICRVRQHSEQQMVKAARLAKEIFQKPFDSSEKELASKLQSELTRWQQLIKDFEFKAKQGTCPGQHTLENGKRLVADLLALGNNSYALIESMCKQTNGLQDFSEKFEEVEEFYTSQFDTWQQLQRALGEQFRANRHALEQDPDATALFAQLQTIHDDKQPYGQLRNVAVLVEQICAINLRLVEQQRIVSLKAIEQIQHGIHSLVSELPADLQHQAMRPFVLLKERVSKSVSLHELVSLVKAADDEEDKVIDLINRFSEQLQAEQARAEVARHAGVAAPSQVQEPVAEADSSSAQATVEKQVAKHQAAPRPIELVSPTELLGDNHLFIETEQDIDAYLGKLRSRLQQAIDGGKRVRIK